MIRRLMPWLVLASWLVACGAEQPRRSIDRERIDRSADDARRDVERSPSER